jgi:hypothetical protein
LHRSLTKKPFDFYSHLILLFINTTNTMTTAFNYYWVTYQPVYICIIDTLSQKSTIPAIPAYIINYYPIQVCPTNQNNVIDKEPIETTINDTEMISTSIQDNYKNTKLLEQTIEHISQTEDFSEYETKTCSYTEPIEETLKLEPRKLENFDNFEIIKHIVNIRESGYYKRLTELGVSQLTCHMHIIFNQIDSRIVNKIEKLGIAKLFIYIIDFTKLVEDYGFHYQLTENESKLGMRKIYRHPYFKYLKPLRDYFLLKLFATYGHLLSLKSVRDAIKCIVHALKNSGCEISIDIDRFCDFFGVSFTCLKLIILSFDSRLPMKKNMSKKRKKTNKA